LPFNEISTDNNASHQEWRMESRDVTHNFASGPTKEHFRMSNF
jgi:hypothetical protein